MDESVMDYFTHNKYNFTFTEKQLRNAREDEVRYANDLQASKVEAMAAMSELADEIYRNAMAATWDNETDPSKLVKIITAPNTTGNPLISDRKTRLIACMIARQKWFSLDHSYHQNCILQAEDYADGKLSYGDLAFARSHGREALTEIEDRVDSVENKEAFKAGRLAQCTCRPNVFTLLQKSIERARKCNIEDGVICEIIRDLVGNPFIKKVEWFIFHTDVLYKAKEMYNSTNEFGQLDSTDLAIMADRLEEVGCDTRVILDHLRKECPYCKDLGNFQGVRALEVSAVDGRVTYKKEQTSNTRLECVCKGTRLARHWKGNFVIDLIIGKS
jgi:hypothetical protein